MANKKKKEGPLVKWGHVNTFLWLMLASQRRCQHQCRADARALHPNLRVHPGLCHSAGMLSHDSGEEAVQGVLGRHNTCLFLS